MPVLVPPDPQQLSETLAAIYDAAVEPARWPTALSRLGTLFHAGFVDRFSRPHDYSTYVGVAVGLDEADYREQFLGFWSKRNVWSRRRPVKDAGEILTTREILDKDELIQSEMYNEYLHPRDLHEGLRLAIWSGPEGIEDISVLRSWSMGGYDSDEIGTAALLMPHLRRAAALGRRLASAERSAATSRATFDHLPQPVMVLDACGRIVQANARASAALREQDAIAGAMAGLRATDASAAASLRKAVAAATRRDGPRLSAAVRLPRQGGGADAVLTLIPLGDHLSWSDQAGPAALAILNGTADRSGAISDRLMTLYGLTEAEASVIEDLAAGDSVIGIAARSRRSVNTVRSHLARAMGKTGTSRQSDIVRLALTVWTGG